MWISPPSVLSAQLLVHAAAMISVWCYTVPFSVLLARYHPYSSKVDGSIPYIDVHKSMQLMGTLLATAAIVLAFAAPSVGIGRSNPTVFQAHMIIGLLIFGCMVLQFALGMLKFCCKDTMERYSQAKRAWRGYVHGMLGKALPPVAWVNCLLGALLATRAVQDLAFTVIVYLIICLPLALAIAAIVVLEIRRRKEEESDDEE
eukprot:TRINITY_DN1954_c0_g1_i1.p1 TRINITY_DN1954_c0_g1~~TRINITY_DN1954_c0_g1_i1.p1  ORF type:complete len:202 (+),score=37.89 TRINITY_DN1954_c0_g1_i1:47-652(+)